MKHWVWTLLFVLAVPAAAATVEEARDAERRGDWNEAVSLWADLVDEAPGDRGIRRAYLLALDATGDVAALDREAPRAAEAFPGWDDPAVIQARALARVGRDDEALAVLDPWAGSSYPAAERRAALLLEQGRTEEAGEVFSSLVRAYDPDVAYTPEQLLAFGRAAWARGDYQGAARVLETAYRDSLDFLPARLALTRLFHEKHQSELAGAEVTDARKLAPAHPDVFVALAELSLQSNQFPRAEFAAQRALAIRDGDPGAGRVLARLDVIADLETAARTRLDDLLARNPHDRETRALLAAAAYFAGDSTTYHGAIDDLLGADPSYVEPYLVLGDILELRIRNREALAVYRRALAADSTNASVWSSLGLLTMREGREAEARGYLEKAFELDEYNIRAYNQLELLDHMETFTTYPGDGYEIRLEAKEDSLLVDLLHESFLRIRDDLEEMHGWSPDETTVLEVFPAHEWFSARVTGLAWVPGIPGVCFGDVIAMDSPRTLQGVTNWEQVLRHEYGHVLALGMTDKQVPFWFTEGLSVYLEEHPRTLSWDQGLVAALWDGELVSVDSLTIAFTRPRTRGQRLLAYHQAGIIIGDLVDRHGWEAVPALLRAFGEGMDLREAVPAVLHESYEDFSRRSFQACVERARRMKVWPAADPDRLGRLTAEVEENPRSEALRDRLLVTLFQLGQRGEAMRMAKEILDEEPGNALALGVTGMLEAAADDKSAARVTLQRAVDAGVESSEFHLALAQLATADRDTAAARAAYLSALDRYPYAAPALLALARFSLAAGDSLEARETYRRLIAVDDRAGEGALELARLELALGDPAGAERATRAALGLLPLDPDATALRGRARLLAGEPDAAFALFAKARRMDLRSRETMLGMGEYYLVQGDPEEALYFARLALKYYPDDTEAKRLLARAEAAI